jgi:hypothetical protein
VWEAITQRHDGLGRHRPGRPKPASPPRSRPHRLVRLAGLVRPNVGGPARPEIAPTIHYRTAPGNTSGRPLRPSGPGPPLARLSRRHARPQASRHVWTKVQ